MEKNYDFRTAQQQAQELWATEKTYHRNNNPGPLVSIDTPPPTVSGSLHIGHIFSYTQTDIIARYLRMQGNSVFYPFGFDDNGLATERFVEKKQGIVAHQLPRAEFIKRCLEESQLAAEEFQRLWKSIGLSADWSQCYSTISPLSQKISQESFIRLYNKGFVYRKKEPALYCTTCRTAVAQAELDDLDVASTFNDILFTAQDGSKLTISTTRPELLPSCVALLYHPSDVRYQKLAGTHAITPLFNSEVPILADESVIPEKGTGLVMVCTFGDKTDILWFKKFKLPYKPSVGLDGKWLASTGPLAGLKAADARKKVLELLQEQGMLTSQKQITHAVNVHERCKKEIEYLMLTQWFLKTIEHKKKFIELADQIQWHPQFMKSRYIDWVENLSWDWCISRQRFYGIPFPAWHCTACDEVVIAQVDQLPIDPQAAPIPGTCPKCSGPLTPDRDVMDTWNTSSITPYICKSLYLNTDQNLFTTPGFMPMTLRPQAHDIIRTWAFYTIIKAWMHSDTIPWNEIVISGHVLSGKEKLSKSKENAKIEPRTLIDTYSADAVRYWTASASLGQDVPFSDNQLKIGQRLVTKLWNALRFVTEHKPSDVVLKEPKHLANQWIMHQATACFAHYRASLDRHEFSQALQAVEQFFWHDFCDNYLEVIKNQLFNPTLYSEAEVTETKQTLFNVGFRILQFYAPYIPHVTETMYQSMYRNSGAPVSIHQTKFSVIQQPYVFTESTETMNTILGIIATVRKLKTEQQLSLKTELETLTLTADKALLTPHEQMIRGVTQAKKIVYSSQAAPNSLVQQDTVWHATVGTP